MGSTPTPGTITSVSETHVAISCAQQSRAMRDLLPDSCIPTTPAPRTIPPVKEVIYACHSPVDASSRARICGRVGDRRMRWWKLVDATADDDSTEHNAWRRGEANRRSPSSPGTSYSHRTRSPRLPGRRSRCFLTTPAPPRTRSPSTATQTTQRRSPELIAATSARVEAPPSPCRCR